MEESRFLENNIALYSYRLMHTHSFVISVFVRAGCLFESENESGITHLFEHIVFRNINAAYGGKLYSVLDRYGLDFNATTYNEMVHFFISGVPSSFSVAAKIISHVLDPINIPSSDYNAERDRIKAEIREADERTSFSAYARRCVYAGTPLARSILGTAGTVSKISQRRLENYRQRILSDKNVFLYLCGRWSDSDADYLASLFGEKRIAEAPLVENVAQVPENFRHRGPLVYHKRATFTKIRIGFDVDMSEVTAPELDLLHDMIFGGNDSPMFTELSEKMGLFYEIDSATERYNNIASLHFSFEIRGARLYEALDKTIELLRRFKTEIQSEERLMRVGYVEGADVLLDDPHELAFTFAYEKHVAGADYRGLEDRKRAYASVSAERLREVARLVLRPEGSVVVVFGDKAKIDASRIKEILSTL